MKEWSQTVKSNLILGNTTTITHTTSRELVLPHHIQVVPPPSLVEVNAHARPPEPLRLLEGHIALRAQQAALDDLASHARARHGDEVAEVVARALREVRMAAVVLALPDEVEGSRGLRGRARVSRDEPNVPRRLLHGMV